MENFYKFQIETVINTFGIKRIKQCATLNKWIAAQYILDDFEEKTLDKALERYANLAASWNEEELILNR